MKLKGTILIADDDSDFVQTLTLRCKNIGFDIITADSGISAISNARLHSPDLIIVDVTMPMGDGFKVCERLLELQFEIPVIILTGKSDAETISNCEALGAHYVLKGTGMWPKLEPLISGLLNSCMPKSNAEMSSNDIITQQAAPVVLAIDDDPDITKALKIRLGFHGVKIIEASNSVTGLMIALRDKPDVIITDYRMPEGSGDYLVVRLRQMKETRSIPIIVLTGQTVGGQIDAGLKRDLLGRCKASAFLTKPLEFDKLIAELEKYIPVKPLKTLAAC